MRQATERDLCNVVATSADIATCSFTVSNPPFEPGFNIVGGSCVAGALVGCNFINVVDGESRVTTGALSKTPLTEVQISRQTFELEPSVSLSPADVNVGDTVTVSLFDYPPGFLGARSIFIAGLDATPAGFSLVIPNSGERSFGYKVPGRANNGSRIPTGTQRFEVFGPGGQGSPGVASQDTDITIAGARLTLSHSSIVANQDLTITGSGFTDGNDVCVVEGDVTINNVAVEIDDDDDCPNAIDTRDGIMLSSGGTFTMTVRVEDRDLGSNAPINTALLTEGSVELNIIDTAGAEGTLQVTIAERTLAVSPAPARPGDVVTIIGESFIASNPDGVPASVDIEYQCGVDAISGTADPDASGNFRKNLRIPSNCAIPSTNTITAFIRANGDTGVVETIIHDIPAASIRVQPTRGPAGSRVTLFGEGFRSFEAVESIEIGGLDVLGARNINTDANGNFVAAELVVPGLSLGIHTVRVEVGTGSNRTSTSTTFEVITPPADISISPWSFNLSLAQGETSVQILGIGNDGEVPLGFDIDVVETTSRSFGPSSAFDTPQPDAWVASAEELARQRKESSNDSPLASVEIRGIPVIHLVTVLADPEGDASGTPPPVDILGVDAGFNQDMLTLSALFSSATDMNHLVGYIHLDTDQDPATGFPPAAQFGNANQDLGADFFLNLFTLPTLGVIGVFDHNSNFITDVVPILQNQSIRVSIPLSALGGDDGRVNLSLVLGNNQGPTEWAPDSGHAQVGPVEWVTVAPSAGTVASTGTAVLAVTFDATDLGPGVFTADLVIHSNDPVQSTVVLPVTLTVTSNDVVVVQPVVAGTLFSGSTFLARIEAAEVGNLAHAQARLTYDQSLFTFVEAQAGAEFSDCLTTILPGQGQVQLELNCSDGHSGVNISLWALRFEAVVVAQDTPTQLTATGVYLSDSRKVPQEIPSVGGVDLTVISESTSPAVPSLKYYQDPVDGAAGMIAQFPPVIDPATGDESAVLLGNFQALLTYDVNCLSIVEVRAVDFSITDLNIDNLNGTATFNGTSVAGVAPTADLAHALTRPIGSNQQLCRLTVAIANLTDPNGIGLDVLSQTATINSQRGDARADGVIDIADALYIAQYLAGSRKACTREGDTTCLHSVNAASVDQDGGIDKPTIDDAWFIAQYLVGLRDEFYDPLP